MLRRLVPFATVLFALGCGKPDRAPAAVSTEVDVGIDDQPGFDIGLGDTAINCSSAGLCACEEIGQKPTTMYLVLDHSGSMLDPKTPPNKWRTIVLALFAAKTGVLRPLARRISLGVTLFPAEGAADNCARGNEILPVTLATSSLLDRMVDRLLASMPNGGTPTAATLVALAPKLKALPPPVYVVLATDGAPNCGTTTCTIEHCSYNVEKVDGCDPKINCCDPVLVPSGSGWGACVDTPATQAAVADLAAAGIKVFIVGIPGSLPYGSDLDSLAVAGNTAREDAKPGEPLYYAASSSTQEALASALGAVAAKVVDTCLITLESPPDDPGVTNVVVDGEIVPQDPIDGWKWTADGKVELEGKTCDRVKKGEVASVQVAVGCKTITR